MAYSAITAAQIAVSEPTKKELFDKIKSNQEDFNTRITTVEATTQNAFPLRFELLGLYGTLATPKTGIMYHRANFDLTLTGAVIMLYEAGTGGTTEIDLQVSAAGGGSFSSVFSTKPSTSSTSDFATSSNAVFSTTDIDAGDILRFDLTSAQTGSPDGLELIVTYTIG